MLAESAGENYPIRSTVRLVHTTEKDGVDKLIQCDPDSLPQLLWEFRDLQKRLEIEVVQPERDQSN